MNKSNRHNLIAVLASLIAVVMIFGMAVVLGGDFGAYVGNESESLDNIYDSSEDTKVESTGWVSGGSTVTSGTAIGSVSALQSFFTSSTATTGYLTGDIRTWSLGTSVSSYTMSSSKTLYGNGHTIYISASSKNGTGNFTDQGGDIGLLLKQNDGKIYNLNIIFTGTFYNQNGNSTWVGTVAGRNTGTIQDVSVELQGPMVTSRANGGSWGQIGGIVGYNSGKLNNVSFNLNSSTTLKDHTNGSNDYQFGSYDAGGWTNYAYAIAGGIAGENNASGVISGCTVKTTQGAIEVRSGSYCTKRVATVCGNNNGSVYGIVTDGSINLETGSSSDMYAYTNGGAAVQCGIDVNGSNNSGRDLSTSSGFTWDWYFTGEGSSTIFHYRKAGVASGEYVYNKIVGSTTTDVASSKVKEATFGMSQTDATFNLQYYYDCAAYAEYTFNGTQYYFDKASEGSKSFSFVYDYNAIPEVAIKYYRLDDSGNMTSTVAQTISKQQASIGAVSVTDGGIAYNASGTRDYVAATNSTFTLTVVSRNVYVEMPDFIYNKTTGEYYDGTSSTGTAVVASGTPSGADIFNKIYAAISCDSNPGYDSTTVQTVNSTTHPGATAISSASQLIAFLNKTTTGDIGYLTTNISITSSDLSGNYFNDKIAQGTKFVLESGSQLYGNGKTITLTYNNGSEWGGNNTIGTVSTFIKENYGLIRDINYTFAGTSIAGLGAQDSYFGLFVGQNASSGVIRNVSVTNTGYVAYHMTPSGYKFYAGVAVGRNDGIIGSLSVTMNSSSGNNAFEIGGPGSGDAYCGGVVGQNKGSAYMLKYTWTNGRLRATSQGYYGKADNLYISTICPDNQGSIYGMTLSNVTQTKVGLNASSNMVSFGDGDNDTVVYLDYYSRNNGSSAVSTFNYGEGFQLGKLPSTYFTNIMDVSGYIKDVNSTVYTEKRALKYNNIGKYDYCNDALASAYGSHTINIVNTAGYYIVGEVLFDFGTYYHKQSADENVDGYTYTKYEKQLSEDSVVNNAITISSGDNSWLTLDGYNYDTAIKNHTATALNTPWEPVAVLNKSRMNVNNGIENSSQACGLNILDLISYSVDTTIYVSKEANSLNVYDLSTTPYTATVTWTYGATSGSDATPKYTFTIVCNDDMFKAIGGTFSPSLAIAGKPSNKITLSSGSFDSGTFSFDVSEGTMQEIEYYGANNTFDLDALYLYNMGIAANASEENKEAYLKAFLSGDISASRAYAGAQTLTLNADVTITSALGSAVIFNQYKTLNGNNKTITLTSATGGNYESDDGTTYSTPGYPTNVIGYTNYVYRGGLAAVSCGTIQNVNIVLGGDLGTSTANTKSYAVGGVVGLNQGGSFSNVKVTVASNQTIGALASPAVWGTLIGISSGGSLHDITIGGDRNKTITNNSGNATYRGYIGGVVGVMNLTDNETNIGAFMGGSSLMFGSLDIAQPSAFNNIYNMYMGSYVGANAFKGLVTGVSYVSGKTPNIATLNNIVYFNKSDSAVPFFSFDTTTRKHDASILSAYGALGQDDSTVISLTNSLKKGVGITLKYDSYNDRAGDGSYLEVLDMLNLTIEGNTVKLNNDKIRLIRCNGASFNYDERTVTFANLNDQVTDDTSNTTTQMTAVLDMSLAVTTADGLNDFLKGTRATDPLMAIINRIDLEGDIEITTWDNTTLLKVDAGRTLNGGNHTVKMNLNNVEGIYGKAYADYSIGDKWNGYTLVYDLMGVNNGTIQNLTFAGQTGKFSSYDPAGNHIIGSLVAVNNGTINGVTYINNGIGTYNNSNSANVTIAGLVAGVNRGAITSTNVFNRALFSVWGTFAIGSSAAMGAIAGVNDGGYATGVKVFGDNAIELVSKTAKQTPEANNNTALYVGGVFGVASNDGAVSFATKTIDKHSTNAVISNANVIVAGGMGIRYSGGTINTYGSRGIFAGIVTSDPANAQTTMSGLAFMDMQTGPNLAVSYVYDAGVLSYFASDRIFNNSLTNGELTMMGYYGYDNGTTPGTSCVSGGKVDIVDYHGNSIFMYNYDATTNTNTYNGKTFLSDLQNYMNGSANTIEFDVKNVSSYLYVNDPMNMGIVCMSATLGSILSGTVLNYDTAKGLSGFATSTVNNVVGGVTYKYKWAIDPGRDGTNQGNIIQGFIEGKTATSFRAAGAALALTLTVDTEVSFDGMSAGRVLEAGRSINGDGHTLTVNVDNGTLDITDSNADNLYAIEGYDVVGVGGLFSAVQGSISNLNIVVNIKGGTINATGTNLAVGGAVGIISGVEPTFGFVQVNYNGTTINFNDGGKTLAFGGAVGAIYNNGSNTSLTLNQNDTNYVYMKGVTMTGTAQNVAVGGAVGLLQGSMLQGGANPTVLYLSSVNRAAGTQGFDCTSTIEFSGTGGLGGLVGIMAGSTLQNINIDQGMSFADYGPSQYLWSERDMVWTLNGGSGSAVSAMGGAVGVSFGGVINVVGVNSRARLINNAGTKAGDTTYNYTGGLLGLGSNSNGMSLTGTEDAYTETINGKTYTLNFTKINNVYAGQIGMIAMPDGGYAGYVTGRYINDTTAYGDNLRNLVWIDFTRKQADLFSKIQVFGATNTAGITLSNVAGMSVLGYVPTDKYNTLIQAGYNKSGYSSDSKLATYSKIMASDFKGHETSLALSVYLAQGGTKVKLLGTMTANGYKPFTTGESTATTQQLKSWTYNVYAADGKTKFFDTQSYNYPQYDVLGLQVVYAIGNFATNDSGDRHNYFRIQLFCDEKIIETEAQLKAFISKSDSGNSSLTGYANASVGVLGANITLNQEPNQYAFDKTLYGAGYTITINALSNATNETIRNQNKVYYANSAGATGNKTVTNFDVSSTATPVRGEKSYIYGLFVAHVSSAGGIYDTNFEFNKKFYIVTYGQNATGTRPTDNNYKDETESMVAGIVCAVNSGVIQNCSLNLGSQAEFVVNRSFPLNTNRWPYPANNMCIAGGFAAISVGATKTNANNHAYINNCTLNMDDRAIMRSICEARRVDNINSIAFPKAQSMVGGMVGWIGEQAHIFNSTLNGGGLLEATTNTRIRFATAGEVKFEKQDYLRTNTYASGAGALVGVNTTSYSYDTHEDQGENDKQPYTNMPSIAGKNVRGEIDGVIINWSGFTMEAICESYRGWQGQVLGSDPSSKETGISYGYRQIAGICDWSTIKNAYLVSYKASGNTGTAMKDSNGTAMTKNYQVGGSSWNIEYSYPAWEMDLANSLEYCYKSLVLKANMNIPTRYVGRGGDSNFETTAPAKEIYLYKNTTSSAADEDVVELEKLSDTVSLSWELVDASTSLEEIKNASLSFDFTVPTSTGGFLWDVQAYTEKPTTLYERARNEDGTDRAGWQEVAGSNGILHWIDTTQGTKMLFYNDVYNKINTMSDAVKYADVSQTFERGKNVYLYYSYGTTGSASIDRNEYYYDSTTGVYYHKTTTSYGNNFAMPALKFYGADGNEITNSSVSNTLFSSILVHRFTGTDPTYEEGMTEVATTPVKDGSGNTIGVNVNDPAAGSYRVSFDTKSNASVTSAIKDIPSKTIIFPDTDIVSGKFKIVEIVTPLGLRAGDMTFIAEKGASASSTTNLHLDVAQILVGGVNVLSGNGDYNYNGINYASKIDGIKPAAMTTSTIGMTNVTLNLEDWEYYGYVPATNSLGTNRSYLIAGSGFTLEYDFEDANNNSYTKLDGTNVKFEVSGSQVTLQGRGLVIPVDSKINYVQKTYNGTNTTSGATVSYGKVLNNSTAGTGAPSFDRYDDANAGNDKTIYMSMSRITFEGYKYKIDRYYQSSGFAMRAASATNSNNTIDNWKNSVDVEASPKSSHQFGNALTASGSGALKTASSASVQVKLIGTILPQEITVKYIAKEYDGTTAIDYSKVKFSYTGGTTGLKPKATFGTADVVYGGQGKYNSIVFSEIVTIVDQTNSTVRYALTDANSTYGNNYAIANNGTYNSNAKTFTLPNLGVIIPQAVQVAKAKKTYDGSDSFVSGMTYNLVKVSNSQSVALSDMGLNSLSSSNGTFANANAGDDKNITIKGTTTFQYPDSSLSTEYGARYFATFTAKNYAYSATTYATGVIIPKQLTWKSNIKNLVYKIYDGTTSYTYASASALFDGLVSGDTTTKPTITFAGSDVKTAGVGISIGTTRNTIDSTYYDQVNGYTNYYMPTSSATGMILPATVTFSGITKVYDGNTDLTDTVYTNMTTTVTNSQSLTGVKLNPVGAFDGRHAYQTRQVVWTTTSFKYDGTNTTYYILQEAKSATSGKNYAGNYCVAGNSNADITPCTLTQADFLGVTAKQNKSDGTTNATGLTFVYFAGAVYLVSGNVKKKNNDDNVDGAYALYKSSSLATTNTDGTYDVGTYDINVTALTGADAGNYTLAVPFDLGQDLVINQQEVNSVAITVMPTNKDYGADLPTATANGWSAKDSVTGGEISGLAFSISAYQWVDDSSNAVTKNSPIGGYNLKVTGITMSGNDNYKLATGATYGVTVTPSGAKALYILPLENTISKVEKVYDGNTNLGTVTATKTISDYVGNYVSKNVQGYNSIARGNVKIKVITFAYYDNTGAQQTKYVIATGNADTMSNYYLDATVTDGYATLQVGVITPKEVTIGTVSITQSDSRGVVANDTKSAPGNFEYYSSATYSYSATLSGVIGGDTVGVSITDPCGGVYNADTYDLTFNSLMGADAGNYEFKGTLGAQLIIKPQTLASVSVSVKPINVVYGNAIPTTIDGATAAATDRKSGAGVTGNFTISGFSTTATSTSPIGGYDITIDYSKVGLEGTTNYVIGSTTTINVTVTPAEAKALYIIPADATINSVTKTYDGTVDFTGTTTIVTTPASITVTGTFADKNAGTGKSIIVNVATFSYYNTQGTAVSVDIFVGTNYKLANTHTTNASVATIDGVGVINKYAIKGSEITGVTVTQTCKGNPSTTSPFEYYYTATYVATGTFDRFNAYGDTVTVTLGIYKSTDGGHTNVSGTTNVGVGTYKISLLSVSATPNENFIVETGAEQYSNTTTFEIDPQVVTNVYVVGNHYATTYTGAPLTYDKSAANFKIYAIDKDDREVNISGGIKENGLTMGNDGQTFATSQTQVGIYNVKVSVNGSAQGNNYTFSAIDNADVYIDANMTEKTQFAIIPMAATLKTAYKTYDGNNTLAGATVELVDAKSTKIDFGDAVVSASFDSANAGNRKLVFTTKEFAYYPTGTTSKTTLNIIQTSTTTPAEGEGEASVSTTFTNYHIGNGNTIDGVAYIIPRLVDLSSPSKVYDGTTSLGGEVSATGTVGGEKISISGNFVDCNAGENIGVTINVTDMELGGVHYNALSGNTNYCIAANNYTGTITQREIESSHLSLLQLARLNAKDGDKQVDMLDIAGSESANLTNGVEYTSMYKYQGIGGHLYVAVDKEAETDGNWSFKLYQDYATEIVKGLTFTVTMLDKNGTEVDFAQNSGTYTIKVVFGGGNYKQSTINTTFTITQQEVTDASKIFVYMDSFEGVYGVGNFKSPNASGYDYRIGIVDKVSGDIVEFVKGGGDNSFAIASLAFSRTQGGTANTNIEADAEGIYIGGYYLFAAAVTGSSDNFDTSTLDLSTANKKIYGIGKEAIDGNQSLYYILPALLDLTAVTKTYDGTVAFTDGSVDANNVTAFTYGSGVIAADKTMRLKGEFVDYNATHNNAGTSGTKGAVKINTEVMSVSKTLAGTTTTTDYNIALSTKDGNVVKTNYYVTIGSAETMIEVSDVAIIKKYKIENGAIQLSVQGYEGYDANSENKVTKYINAPADTIEFTYANGYRYNDKFVIMGLQPIAGQGLFNATDDINAMSVVLGPDNISNASNTPYDLVVKSFTASNYEWGSNATIGKLKINKQLVNEDSIAISIPPLALEYNGNVQKPEGVDKFSFTVKDFYTGLSAKADGAGGSGVSGIKYYKDSVEVPNPTDIGGYSVSVVVDTSYIDTNNYKMADGVSSITKQADNGNAVFFILPKALTVTNVTKQYDGNANFVDMQVNGVTTSDNPKTIITIDDGGFVAADNTVDTKNAVYSAIIAAGGYFDSKDIAETVSVVYFRSLSFSYRNTVDGVVTGGTAYYINGTNYMVPSASVGYITPAHLTITGMTKTYDGTTTLQFEYSYDSGVGVNKTTESVEGAMNNGEAIRPAGEYTSADVTAVGTKIAVKFNVTEMVIGGVTYYRLVNNAKDGGTSNASNYYIYTSNDSFDYANGMITIDGIGTIKAIAISDGTTGTTADASISNITIDGKAYDSTSAFIYNYSKSYGVANLKATFKFFGGELTCQGEFDSTKNMMKVVGVNGDVLYFTITFTNQTSAKDAGEYVVKIELKEIESANNNAYEFGTAGALTLSKKFKINKYQLKQDELKIFVAALEREYNGREGIVTDGSNATTWVADKVNSTLTYTITLSGATTSSTLTIYSVKKTNEAQEFINVGAYALQAQVRGYSDTNYMLGDDVYYNLYRRADQSADVFEITPMLINLEAETEVVKNFDGTASYLYAAGVAGEQVLIGNNAIDGRYARAGVHTLENTTLEILDVVLDPTVDGFNSTLYNEETKVLDRDTAKANYKIVGTTTYKLTINPSNIVVAERRYDGTSAEIEVAITGLAGTQFLNDTVDKTNLAGVLKISVNSFASFELATTDEIVESSIKKTESTDALGYVTYTITFNYLAKGTLDAATYTDRYVFAVAGATDGYSTNLALTSSELADGQMSGAAITTGTAVANAEALATALKANADIHLTANIYGWDASLLDSAITYTGTLQGNGYSIQLASGLNSDGTNGGAFIASLGGTIRDVNFKFTSDKALSGATNVGLVVGNMAGNMTNVSLDIINTPTFDGATTIGGLAGTASGSMTNATVIFNASVDNTAFGGLAGSATNATFTNVSVRGYNGKTTTGKTLVATSSGCTFNGVIDMIGGTLGASNITNLYTVNALATGAKANGKLELLTPHTEGFIEYYFTTLNKTGVKTHNVYGGGASERDKTMYQTYGAIATNDTVALAIETLAPRNRFIWEAYSHSYQTEVAGGGHVNLSLNRYVAFMPIGTVIAEDGYTLDGQSKTDMSFITVDVTMFRPAIGIRGSQEIAASGSIIKEVEYTGGQISHEVSITVDGKVTSVSVSGVDAGYYDNIVVELTGDVTTDDINYDTTNRTAVVAKIDDGATVAGAILIIYPKQSDLPTDFSKYYDTTSIGEFTTTIDGKSVTLLGTYVDNTKAPASDVGTSLVSFANTLNPIRNVLVDKDGNYIAQHHKTESDGTTTFSYTKISVTTTGEIESYFTTSTDFSAINKNSLMRAIAQLIDYDKATTNDATLVGNANYTNAWVYNVTAIKAADSADGYFDGTKGYFFVPKTIGTNAGNVTFTADGLAVGSMNNIYIGATEPSAFTVLAGTTSSNASILPAELGATYTGDLEQCFRSTSLSTNIALTKGEWVAFTLPTTMTEAQKTAFNTFKTNASVAIAGTAILGATSGISKNGNVYTADHDNNTVYLQLDLPTQFAGINENGVNGTNYVIKPTAQVLKLRYFFIDTDGKYKLETYKDVLMIGKAEGDSDYHTLGYKMKNNINMKSSLITPFDWGNGIAFAGTIDGAGYALTNYILKGESNVGLFANMGATASVTNLVMGNVMVVATATTGDVTVSALTTSTVGSVTDVATEMRVVTATTGSVSVANADESFVRVHKQSGSNVTVSTLLNGTTKDTYLTPSDIATLTKFGSVANFLDKYVLNNTKLTYTATDAKITVDVNNFREYWGWYNICPWLEGGKSWLDNGGIRPTKINTTQTVTQ